MKQNNWDCYKIKTLKAFYIYKSYTNSIGVDNHIQEFEVQLKKGLVFT